MENLEDRFQRITLAIEKLDRQRRALEALPDPIDYAFANHMSAMRAAEEYDKNVIWIRIKSAAPPILTFISWLILIIRNST